MDSRSRKLHSRGGLEHLPKCISLVSEAARRAGLSAARHGALEAAVRDAYLAIAEGDPREKNRGPVEVEVAWDRESVTVCLTHPGAALERLPDRETADPRLEAMRRSLDEVSSSRGGPEGPRLLLRVRVGGEGHRRAPLRRVSSRRSAESR